jgi:predicted DNA-binding transcriptional regulator AlpA
MATLDSVKPAIKPFPDSFQSDRIVSPKMAAAALGISMATLRRLWDQGRGPRKIQISPRRIGVRLRDIHSYIETCGGAA